MLMQTLPQCERPAQHSFLQTRVAARVPHVVQCLIRWDLTSRSCSLPCRRCWLFTTARCPEVRFYGIRPTGTALLPVADSWLRTTVWCDAHANIAAVAKSSQGVARGFLQLLPCRHVSLPSLLATFEHSWRSLVNVAWAPVTCVGAFGTPPKCLPETW